MSADLAGGATVAGCCICKESLTKTGSDSVVNAVNTMVTPCGHAFHSRCINHWMSLQHGPHATCPNCRKDIRGKACMPLFLEELDTADFEGFLLAEFVESADRLKNKLLSAQTAQEMAQSQLALIRDDLLSCKLENMKLRLSATPDTNSASASALDAERKDEAEKRIKIADRKAQQAELRAQKAETDLEFLKIERSAERMVADNKFKRADTRVKEANHRAEVAEQRAVIAEAGHKSAETVAFSAKGRALKLDEQLKTAQSRATVVEKQLADIVAWLRELKTVLNKREDLLKPLENGVQAPGPTETSANTNTEVNQGASTQSVAQKKKLLRNRNPRFGAVGTAQAQVPPLPTAQQPNEDLIVLEDLGDW